MKIWHYSIIPKLPTPMLSILHCDCCALRGKSWGSATTPKLRWLWQYPIASLEWYHLLVIEEMEKRQWHPNPLWKTSGYRGKRCTPIDPSWQIVPKDGPTSVMFKEFTPNYLFRDQKDLRKWQENHPEVPKIL